MRGAFAESRIDDASSVFIQIEHLNYRELFPVETERAKAVYESVNTFLDLFEDCLLYTSDAADE